MINFIYMSLDFNKVLAKFNYAPEIIRIYLNF